MSESQSCGFIYRRQPRLASDFRSPSETPRTVTSDVFFIPRLINTRAESFAREHLVGGDSPRQNVSVGDKSRFRENGVRNFLYVSIAAFAGTARVAPRGYGRSSDIGEVAKHTSVRVRYFPRNLETRALHKFIYRGIEERWRRVRRTTTTAVGDEAVELLLLLLLVAVVVVQGGRCVEHVPCDSVHLRYSERTTVLIPMTYELA